jgi:ketosteroid isomerase-like protein
MNEAPLAGKEAVLENAQRTQGISVTRTPLRADVAASGELGYTWGSALIHVTYPNGTSTMQSAKYVTVWRKNADGQWKIVADIVNQSPVPTGT